MADKKPDNSDQSEADQLLVKKVDDMMNVRADAPDPTQPAMPNSDISSIAASINESLAKDLDSEKPEDVALSEEPSDTLPEEPPETPEEVVPDLPAEPDEVAATAPELPAEEPVDEPPGTTEEVPPEVPEEPEEAPVEADSLAAILTEQDVPPVDPAIGDKATDQAVEEIVAKEGDTILAVEDAKTEELNKAVVLKESFGEKVRRIFLNRKAWLIILIIALVVFAVPATRYKLLGLVIKKSVTITVIDSKTSTPVSNAQVQLAGSTSKTDANGKAKVSAGLGKRDLVISKKYYKNLSTSYFVGIKSSSSTPIKLVATGRLVPVVVVNTITGKPIAGVQIIAKGTTAKTDAKGMATIALPTTDATYSATLGLKGYNATAATIHVTDKVILENRFSLTPAGQVYFLSNLSGKLDVVKANLDGTGRKTVIPGTGKEDPKTTSLLASRDWRYLVLKAHHEGDKTSLYLIDTSNDKVTQFDNSDSEFTLIGWYDHAFMYSLIKNGTQYWQAGRQVLKGYDADHLQLNQIDQNQAEGDANGYAYQNFFNFYVVDGSLVYNTEWNKEGVNAATIDLAAKNDTIRGAQPNGQSKKDYQSFPTSNTNFIQATLYQPQTVYYAVYDSASKPTYYSFQNNSVKPASIDQSAIDKTYPTYLLSPTGNQTFWSELRDGKNALFTSDSSAGKPKPLATLSDYAPYGWFTDNYVLVSKNSSELYIASPTTLSTGKPAKINDYYKPAQTYSGYGYGYGGL